MSILFGIRKFRGATVSREEILAMATATQRHAPDGVSFGIQGRIGMGFQPWHTHQRSNLETLPVVDCEGNLLCLDGRIDNHEELASLLGLRANAHPDSSIFLTAFRRWKGACFSRIIGDWAAALWSAKEQTLYLARDHAGSRTLYYRQGADVLLWSTHVENLLADGSVHGLDKQYAACYLGMQPVGELTPYESVRSVPTAHYLELGDGKTTLQRHWDPLMVRKTRHSSDGDYEEHFRSLFEQSVRRRTGAGAPIIAQLSGGMDSASIVCMSDKVRRGNNVESLDTVSYFDDSEPNWNERPYFSLVENARGKTGIQIEASFVNRTFKPVEPELGTYSLPGADSSIFQAEVNLQRHLGGSGHRVILSGLGGDEVTGGVPSPLPELADYLLAGEIDRLLKMSVAWCLVDRTPLAFTLASVVKFTAGLYWPSNSDDSRMPPWITALMRQHNLDHRNSIRSHETRLGVSPSAVNNANAWASVLGSLPHLYPSALVRYEYRYPYLDRDLVEFLFGIPREQLVRPGRRRSLMRRALKGIVPMEILERRRKAFVVRGPMASLQRAQATIETLFADSLAVHHGLIDRSKIRTAIDDICVKSDPTWMLALMKSIEFELWLRSSPASFLPGPGSASVQDAKPGETMDNSFVSAR